MKKLVFDIGGSFIKYALMDQMAQMSDKGSCGTPLDSLEHLLDEIERIYHLFDHQVDGIALSMPGNIDSSTGLIASPGALFYNMNVNIIHKIQERIQLPIAVENDGKSAALAEVWKGNLSDCENGVVLILGTGVGGGIIKNRKIHKGSHFFAGEFSFVMCNDENLDFSSAFALKASTSAFIGMVAAVKELDPQRLTGHQVFDLIHRGDEAVIGVFNKFCMNLAVQIYNLQCILDPDKFLIGGGISQQAILVEKVREQLAVIYQRIPFPIPHAEVGTCKYFNDSNLIGALYNFYCQFPESE